MMHKNVLFFIKRMMLCLPVVLQAKTPSSESMITCFLNEKSVQGPLFSAFNTQNKSDMLRLVEYVEAEKNKAMTRLIKDLTQFTKQEYKKKSIVLFHGQQSQWAFLEQCCNELCYIKYGIVVPDTFVRMRFQDKVPVADSEAAQIRSKGTHWNSCSTSSEEPSKVLFVNLHPLANNDYGSNSFYYVYNNSDCSAYSYEQDERVLGFLEKMFKEFGYAQEFKAIRKKDKGLFNNLFHLYKELVETSGGVGRFIAFSLPRPLAQKRAYPTYWCGDVLTKLINGKETDDIVKISDNFSQIPFDSEYVLILSKEICDPQEAKKAGVVIKAFDAFDRASTAWKNFNVELTKVMKLVAEQYAQRVPGAADKVKKYVKELVALAAQKKK